jgi:cell division protein FtsQ
VAKGGGGGRPPIDPRIRQRRVDVSRRAGRRRLYLILGGVVAIGLGIGAWFLLHSSAFSARVITVSGSEHTSTAAVEAAGGLTAHPPLISVDAGAVAARVEALPWVKQAVISKEWPDGLHVKVVERAPVAFVTAAHGVALVDATGRVLSDVPTPPAGLPSVAAKGAVPAPGGSLGRAAASELFVVASLPTAFRAQVRGVSVDKTGFHLDLTSPVTVTLGSTSQLQEKWHDVASILKSATLHPHDVIDVSAPGSPTVDGP